MQHTLKLAAIHSIMGVNVNRSQFARKKNIIASMKCIVTLASVHIDMYTADGSNCCVIWIA